MHIELNNQKHKTKNQTIQIPHRRIHRDWGERMYGRRERMARADPLLVVPKLR